MPLPAALAARLAKRGILNEDNSNPSLDEEVIAESYDKPNVDNHTDEFGNPLPPNWEKVWEPDRDTWYYWHILTDKVSWLPPDDPEAVITFSASKKLLKITDFENELEKQSNQYAHYHKGPQQYKVKSDKKSEKKPHSHERKKNRSRQKGEFDPMDPSSYSDAPVGNWSSGLKKLDDAKTGVDSTANGPLFQQRPYPSPGEVLSRNKQARQDYGPVKPK